MDGEEGISEAVEEDILGEGERQEEDDDLDIKGDDILIFADPV